MSRRYTRRGTALLLVLALLVSMLGAALPVMQKSGTASGTFATAYTALLEKAPVAQADLERDPYGLCRLVVTGYGGKDYGAAPGGADRRRRVHTESYLAYGVRHGRRVRGAPRTGNCLF